MKKTTLIALSKLLAKEAKKARPDVSAGEYELDEELLLRVAGTLSVADDQTYTPTMSMPWRTVLALFVRRCACHEKTLALLEEAMDQALRSTADAAELLKAEVDLDAAAERVQATLDALPRMVRRGKVEVGELKWAEVKARKAA